MKDKQKLLIGGFAVLLLAALVASFRVHRPSGPPPLPVKPKVSLPAEGAAPLPPFPKGSGKIAIVLDDWGYNKNQLPYLSQIREPMTIAVLPSLPHSADAARAAQAAGHEVILHMPMEAESASAPREKGTLLTSMSKQEVIAHLSQALATVPFARGLSNHQGSKATADLALMEIILQELKSRRLYFLDSMVSPRSVCKRAARDVGVRYVPRNVFIDNSRSPASIRQALIQLARAADRFGLALAIGHDRPYTLKVLVAAMPELRKAGYTLVTASQLAKSQ